MYKGSPNSIFVVKSIYIKKPASVMIQVFLIFLVILYYDTFSSFFMTEKINPAAIRVRTMKIAHTCQIGILS